MFGGVSGRMDCWIDGLIFREDHDICAIAMSAPDSLEQVFKPYAESTRQCIRLGFSNRIACFLYSISLHSDPGSTEIWLLILSHRSL